MTAPLPEKDTHASLDETEVLIRLFAFEVARIELIAAGVGLPADRLIECWIRAAMRDNYAERECAQ